MPVVETPNARLCPSCDQPAEGNYCMHCGEKLHHETITLRYLVSHIPDLFDVEKGLFHTMVTLFKNPGRELRKYFMGNRSRHYKPFKYIFFLATISQIINIFVSKNYDPLITEEIKNTVWAEWTEFAQDWNAVIWMLTVPAPAAVSYLMFRRKPYTYGEHLVAHAYLMGQMTIMNIIINPLRMLEDSSIYTTISGICTVAFMIYAVYYYYDWIYGRRTFAGVMRSFLTTLLVGLTSFVVAIIIAIILYYFMSGVSGLL